jgi:tetratricopeptide (TPR) repeat protein
MPRRSPRARSESGLWNAPAFPRPVSSFAGRETELQRITRLVDDEVVFLVYGVGGIGKSELVYRAIHELRTRPAWGDATPVLMDIRPDTSVTRAIAQLLAALGAAPEPRRGQPTEQEHLGEQLTALAQALESRRYLLFLDDLHHLPLGPVAEAFRYLARHVRASRIFAASRREIRLPADAPPPVITTLGPLDEAAATEMMTALAGRMQVPRPDPDEMLRTTHGSPFEIRQMLVRHDPAIAPVEESLRALAPTARRLLLAATVAHQRLTVSALRRSWSADESLDEALRDLEQRFLLDTDHDLLVVHDLIGEALLAQTSPEELATAHRESAELCLEQLRGDDQRSLLLAVDAVTHFIAAGHHQRAWDLIETWFPSLAAAGSEHLLLEPLDQLRAALPGHQIAIDLLIARCLIRASLIEQAGAVLARVDNNRSPGEEARHALLSGEIAQRRGELDRAEELFERAAAHAPDQTARWQARLQSASVAAFRGDGARAREILDTALTELPNPTARQRARWGWTRAMSWSLDERFEIAAGELRRIRTELAGSVSGISDLIRRLAMLEILAYIECDQMQEARATSKLLDEAGARKRVADLYRALVAYGDGDTRASATALVDAYDYLKGHGDTLNTVVAGYYGIASMVAIGQIGEAQALAERTAKLVKRAGMLGVTAQIISQQAMLAAEAVQSSAAHRLADQALAIDAIGPRSRARAHNAHARAYTIEGDISLALEQLALAREAISAPDLEAARPTLDVEQAAIELVGGNLERAVELAESAATHFRERSRDFEAARAQMVLAGCYVARGRRADIVFAEQALANASELADRGELSSIQVGCAILSAALAKRANRGKAADDVLANALRTLGPERGTLAANTLLAAIENGAVAAAVPGAVALLGHLGLSEAVGCYIVDQHGRRAATEKDVARERGLRELFVDEARSVIAGRGGEVEISGRPMQCALLSVLIQARGESVAPDTLYKRVWGVSEYHPLQHRNALYVAINRLRKSLKKIVPDREVVLRGNNGWRLPADLDACAIVPVREQP